MFASELKSSTIDSLLPMDQTLEYEPLVVQIGQPIHWHDLVITMRGIDKEIDHPNYQEQEGDVAIQGVFDIENKNGKHFTARPLYYIRDGKGLNMKWYVPSLAFHIAIASIDPEKNEFHIYVAQPVEDPKLAIEVAEDAPRNDYIVLEAILFPGINLFWSGSIMMLFGVFLGFYKRLRKK